MSAMALFTAADLSCVLSDTACAAFFNAFSGDLCCAVVFPQRQSASCVCSCLVAQACCTGFPSFRGQLVQAAIFGVPFAKALADCTLHKHGTTNDSYFGLPMATCLDC